MERNEVLIYITEDGTVKLEVAMESETVWLNLNQLCELFQRDKSVISRHIKNIYTEGELEESSTVAFFATVQNEGGRSIERKIAYYNLDVIISVGYRVKSLRGTQFRKWALKILKEYMIKGFALDDDRLKNLGGGNYFEELLSRIRSIRASEKVFWRKVLDIYATSIDYEPKSEISVQFFKQVQNKMHWAAHRHTAAEVIYERADSEKEFMGLTSWRGEFPERTDAEIAKNYLSREELEILDRLVSAYLDIAELRAMNREPMYMKDWLETIDDYLKMTRRDILTHKGRVSHRQALEKAHKEYEKYSEKAKQYLSAVEKHYLEAISTLEGIEEKQE